MTNRERAAHAYERRSWGEAYRLLSGVPPDRLGADDLHRLAVAAYLLGREEDAMAAWELTYKRHLETGDRVEAALCAFWVAVCSMLLGKMAHAGGWLSRCQGLVDDDLDCAAAGYLLVPALLAALDSGEPQRARELAVRAREIAVRFDDADLAALSTLGLGQALLAIGDESEGLARLDEVMLSVSSGDVGPIASGIVYCTVILECMQIFDLARATEWTSELDRWCASEPDMVPFRGQCLVHQSQLQQAAGNWSLASSTVASASQRLADPPHPALGLACYQEGELPAAR